MKTASDARREREERSDALVRVRIVGPEARALS